MYACMTNELNQNMYNINVNRKEDKEPDHAEK